MFVIRVSLLLTLITFIFIPVDIIAQEKNGFDLNKVRQAVNDDLKENGSENDNPKNEDINYGFLIFKMIGYVLFLTLIVISIIWGLKKTGFFGAPPTVTVRSMDVLESLPLGPNRSIVLVRMMDQVLVLGQTAQSITTLGKIEGQQAVELITAGDSEDTVRNFKDVFGKFVNKMKKN